MPNPIGELIRNRREAQGVSLKKLGDSCGVSDSEIQKIESGKRQNPNWSTLCKIAHELNFHPFELLLAAGYISDADIDPVFRLNGLNRLSLEDLEEVQVIINARVDRNARRLMQTTEFRMGELFCGPGGLAWGAAHAHIENEQYRIVHAWANDFDKETCDTYRHNICPNNPDSVYCEDVHTLDINQLGDIDAFSFGFPCNDFSVVGEQKGFDGTYGPLYTYGVRVLRRYQPLWFWLKMLADCRVQMKEEHLKK